MHLTEWPLILFTLLVQMSVGTFLLLGILNDVRFVKMEERISSIVSNSLLKLISIILLFALIAALFHLGNPLNAINALNNLESSYLSKEIFSLIIYIVTGGIFLYIYKKFRQRKLLIFITGIITILFGFRTIHYMSSIYMLETVPVWNSLFTPLSFYLSVLLLGSSVIYYSLIRLMRRNYLRASSDESTEEKLSSTLNFLLIVITFLLLSNFALFIIQIIYLGNGNDSLRAAFDLLTKENLFYVIFKFLLLITGFGLSFILIKKYRTEKNILTLYNFSAFYFILILLIEFIGRFLFYASYHRIGV